MATARELLEQADALMRRNRLRDAGGEGAASKITVLTEVVGPVCARPDGAPAADAAEGGEFQNGEPGAPATPVPAPVRPADTDANAIDFDDVPLLTDVVADLDPISVLGTIEDAGEPMQWPAVAASEAYPERWMASGPADALVPAREDTSGQLPTGAPPGDDSGLASPVYAAAEPVVDRDDLASPALAAAEPVVDRDDGDVLALLRVFPAVADGAVPVKNAAAGSQADGSIGGGDDVARWESLAEEVRMQVLQRIDIFTDTGLQEQLTARLQPIVDRASADLVATINQQVGQLLRAYVAEAIEREIDKWRHDGV